MICLYCHKELDNLSQTVFDCLHHKDWDIRYSIYNSINSTVYLTDTLHTISFLSTDDQFMIQLDMLNKTTSFTQFSLPRVRKQYPLAKMNELLPITPDNATQWRQRISHLISFS